MPLDNVEQEIEELEETPKGKRKNREQVEGKKEGDGDDAQMPGKKKKNGKSGIKAFLWVIAPIVLCGLAYFLLKPVGGKGPSPLPPILSHALGEQTVNLADGKTALRISIVVEVNNAACINQMIANDAMLRDKVIEILSVKAYTDMDTVVERNRLKRELLDDFNLELNLSSGRMMKIYFREFYYFTPGETAGTGGAGNG